MEPDETRGCPKKCHAIGCARSRVAPVLRIVGRVDKRGMGSDSPGGLVKMAWHVSRKDAEKAEMRLLLASLD